MIQVTLKTRVLQEYIARKNLSLREFATQIGMSSGFVCQIINGRRILSPAARQRILDATGLEFDTLFTIEFDEAEGGE